MSIISSLVGRGRELKLTDVGVDEVTEIWNVTDLGFPQAVLVWLLPTSTVLPPTPLTHRLLNIQSISSDPLIKPPSRGMNTLIQAINYESCQAKRKKTRKDFIRIKWQDSAI